jgi:hypothetical protein
MRYCSVAVAVQGDMRRVIDAESMLLECIRRGDKIAGRPGPIYPRRSAGVGSFFGG